MAPATNTGNKHLRIDLAAPPGWTYAAGDTIIGHVVRHSSILSPDAIVAISLVGRVKTKFSLAHSKTGQEHRSRWNLWAPKSQTLFSGPLHSPTETNTSDALAWSFAVMIPTCPEASAADGHSNQETFIPFNPESINQPLPGSYYSTYNHFDACHETFVEYYLEAQLSYIFGGARKIHRVVHPIILKHPASQRLTGGDELQRHTIKLKIWNQQSKKTNGQRLTICQKIQKCLEAPETRESELAVEVYTPRLIELDDPSPFPFIIRIPPQANSTDVSLKDTEQKIQVNWVKCTIYSRVQFRASTRNRPHVGDHFFAHHLRLEKVFRNLGSPITLSSDKGEDEVDIGRLLELRLTPGGLLSLGKLIHAVPGIHPDFATYNMKHSNSLEWKMSITIGRETRVIQEESSQLTISAPRR